MTRTSTPLLLATLALLFPALLEAQSPRMVLIEEATNASCGPCAEQNPYFEHFLALPHNQEYIIPVVYHSNFPGSDVMNAANTAMHNNRVRYYGISGVPSALVNGKVAPSSGSGYAGAPSDTVALARAASPLRGTLSPITINVNHHLDGTEATANVTVSSTEAIAGKKLHIVVAERHHYYANAGNNGERDFHYVARTMLPLDGTELTLGSGETRQFQEKFTYASEWNAGEIYIVAFVQDPATREVLQAGTDRGHIRFLSDGRLAAAQGTSEPREIGAELETNNSGVYTVTIDRSLPEGWGAEVRIGEETITSGGTVTLDRNAGKDISVRFIPAEGAPGKGAVNVTITGERGTNSSQRFTLYAGAPQAVVITRDEGNPTIAEYYRQAMAKGDVSFTMIERGDEDLFDLKNHVVVYEMGKWGVEAGEIERLRALFDRGARVFLAGAEIAFSLADSRNNDPTTPNDHDFLRRYLHAEYVADDYQSGTVSGAPEDPIGDGMRFSFATGVQNQDTPDELAPRDGAVPIFFYDTDLRHVAGIRYADTKNRLVYLGFGLEGVGLLTERAEVLRRGIAWLLGSETTSGVEAENHSADVNELMAIHPNPASGSVEIPFRLADAGSTTVALYNLRGELVTTLAAGIFPAGESAVRLDLTSIPSGEYIVVLKSGAYRAARPLVVVR